MSDFKIQRIRSQSRSQPISTPRRKLSIRLKKPLKILLIILGLVLLWNVPKQLFRVLEKPLEHDRDGHTNILLLGVGGFGHEGADLTDTIMVASINLWDPAVSFLSLPRDLYVTTKKLNGVRLNAIYELAKKRGTKEALDIFKNTVENILNISIHYVAKVDFSAFTKVVDSVGGIDITLEEPFSDPFYPKDGTEQFEPLFFAKGKHHLDGAAALKLARSRKTSSDFARSARQQMILQALQQKTLSLQVLANPRRIAQVFDIIRDHLETDLSLRRILALGEIGTKLDRDAFVSAVIHDDPSFEGGFLYVPARAEYGGAFVLLPQRDSWEEIRLYARTILYDGQLHRTKVPLQVFNGTKTPNLAANAKSHLKRFGFSVIRFGNGRTQNNAKTTIYYKQEEGKEKKEPAILRLLRPHFPDAAITSTIPPEYETPAYQSEARILIELGQDYAEALAKLEPYYESIYVSPNAPSPVTADLAS